MITHFFKWLWALVKHFGVFILTRLEVNDYYLVLNGDHEHIMERLSTGGMSDFSAKAQEALLKRDRADEIEALLKNKKIANTRLKQLVIDRNQSHEIALLCQKNLDVPASDIIRQGHFKALLSLLKENEISEEDMTYILQNFTHFQIMEILEYRNIKLTEAQILLILNRGNDEEIEKMLHLNDVAFDVTFPTYVLETIIDGGYKKASSYLAVCWHLSSELAMKYIHRYADDIDMLDDYIYNNYYMSDAIQLEIVKNFSHSAVMSLLDYIQTLCDEAQLAIVQKGDMDEIKRLIDGQKALSDDVINALLLRNAPTEMKALAESQTLSTAVLMHWINNYRFDYVETYLANHDVDSKFSAQLMLEVLKRTVK